MEVENEGSKESERNPTMQRCPREHRVGIADRHGTKDNGNEKKYYYNRTIVVGASMGGGDEERRDSNLKSAPDWRVGGGR